jgi:hypothetical protein
MYTPERKKPFFERFQERMAASRFLTFSALVHAVLLFLAGGVVLYKQPSLTDFTASGGLIGEEKPQGPPEQAPEINSQFHPDTPQIKSENVINTQGISSFSLPASFRLNSGTTGEVPGTMQSRMGGTARQTAMLQNGGKKESEQAVVRGLRWLVKMQNPDGSWGKGGGPVPAAMTGLSILSFLGHGETPASAEFGTTVQKALAWVLEKGKKNDGHLCMQPQFSQQGVYAHGIVCYALGEYYTITKDDRVVDLLKKAVGYIVDGQGPDGGWMYAYDKTESDTSVSGWQIQALKAAHLSGLNIDGVDAALDKAMLDLERVRGKNGGYGYRSAAQEKYSLTGVGVLCTYFWKQEKDKGVREGIAYIMDHAKKDFPVQYKHEKADLYAWYYNTQACLMVGGQAWSTWNHWFQDEIVKNQDPDGSWPPMTSQAVGQFQQDTNPNGPFYRTNLCILMLEVYYRYMPTNR